MVDLLRRTQCFVIPGAISGEAVGQSDYQLPLQILSIEDIYITSSGSNARLRRLASTDLLNMSIYNISSSPAMYYSLSGANLFRVYPAPLSSDIINIDYVPRPAPLVNPTDDPSNTTLGGIPSEFHYGIELYAMWQGGMFFEDAGSQNGQGYRVEYEGANGMGGYISHVKRALRNKGGKHLAGVLIPPRTRKVYSPLPGVDTGSTFYT